MQHRQIIAPADGMTLPEQQRHIYLVQTCLQFVLATALAEESRQSGNQHAAMVFVPSRVDAATLLKAARHWETSPFCSIDFVQPELIRRGARAGRHRRGGSAVLESIDRTAPTIGYVFNDRDDPGQMMLIELARHYPLALRCAVEDGAQAYTQFRYRSHSTYTRLRHRLLHGAGWSDVPVLGTHPYVQQFISIFPSLLRPELRGLHIGQFPTRQLSSEPLQELGQLLCKLSGFDANRLPLGSIIVTASHSDYARRSPDYVRVLGDCVDALRRHGLPYAYKYHPGEQLQDYLGLSRGGMEVPRSLPAECLYLISQKRAAAVIGGASTALMTARTLLGTVKVLTIDHASLVGEAWNEQLLLALGFQKVSNGAELIHALLPVQRSE